MFLVIIYIALIFQSSLHQQIQKNSCGSIRLNSKEQSDFLNTQFGAVCFVYNKALGIMKNQYKANSKLLKRLKTSNHWFKRKHLSQGSYHCTAVTCGKYWIKIPKLKTKVKSKAERNLYRKQKSLSRKARRSKGSGKAIIFLAKRSKHFIKIC